LYIILTLLFCKLDKFKSFVFILSLFLFTALGFVKELKAEERLAFLVGIKAYDKAPLRNTIRDTEIIAKALYSVGFKVTRYSDLDARELLVKLDEFLSMISHKSTILFYYSGHGIGIQGENFLAPLRDKVTGKNTVVSLDKIIKKLEKHTQGVRLVFIDACRTDPRKTDFNHSQISQGFAPMGGVGRYSH
jgi:uncharacterized caspase-like protein